MPTYEFRCAQDGTFELRLPMDQAAPTTRCPACGSAAARVFSAPALATSARAELRLIEASERTADEPGVVAAPPPRATGRARPAGGGNPARARLPRP